MLIFVFWAAYIWLGIAIDQVYFGGMLRWVDAAFAWVTMVLAVAGTMLQ